jgi:hypothetical protein
MTSRPLPSPFWEVGTTRRRAGGGRWLALAVDAVLLMADTLVLGSGSQVHVSLPDLTQNH